MSKVSQVAHRVVEFCEIQSSAHLPLEVAVRIADAPVRHVLCPPGEVSELGELLVKDRPAHRALRDGGGPGPLALGVAPPPARDLAPRPAAADRESGMTDDVGDECGPQDRHEDGHPAGVAGRAPGHVECERRPPGAKIPRR